MTATGLPFLVTVTRSCVPATSSITWLKCALTAASDCVVMTSILVREPATVKWLGRRSPGDAAWVEPRCGWIDDSRDPVICCDVEAPSPQAVLAEGRR